MKKPPILVFSLIVLILLLSSCPPSNPPQPSISLNPTEKTLYTNESQEFSATISELGTTISDDDVFWSVSCGNKIRIGKNKIKYTSPLALGTCVITAKLISNQEITATANVNVVSRPSHCREPLSIPDNNLQKAIKAQLGISRTITCTDLEGMTELRQQTVYNRPMADRIKDLTGLEYAVNLTRVDLMYNLISDLSVFSNFSQLNSLSLHSNRIVDIEALKNLRFLRFLQLSSNRISDLSPLKDISSLQDLRIFANRIINIDALEDLTNLKTLWLSHNSIKDITALVANAGLRGAGDTVEIKDNCLDLTSGSQNLRDINSLKDRGVTVKYEEQRDCS